MIIRTPEQRFTVLRVLQHTEEQEICLCQELGREPEEVSTLIRFRNPARSRPESWTVRSGRLKIINGFHNVDDLYGIPNHIDDILQGFIRHRRLI